MSDVVVIGSGPAGMSAARELLAHGLAVTVVDDQPAPGGRIFAAIETRDAYTPEDREGAALAAAFRTAGGEYLPNAEVWQIESGPRIYLTQGGVASLLEPKFVILATGAQERPMPFSGWQLPGVMTVGAAQILLKTARQIPDRPVWLAGCGPLLLLYAHQLKAAGGTVAGILDTTPRGQWFKALPSLPSALSSGWRDFIRGAVWMAEMCRTRVIRDVVEIEAIGSQSLTGLRYRTGRGASGRLEADLLLIHDGVVPAIHSTMAAGLQHRWNEQQQCFEPALGSAGKSSDPAIYVVGDGATIRGARAAILTGRLAAIEIARELGVLSEADAERPAKSLDGQLAASTRFRRFLDTLYPSGRLSIGNSTIVCRCEEVTARELRACISSRTHLDPDGLKAVTRAGMGPCQGRQCGLTVNRLIAETRGIDRSAVGFFRIRPPLKPLTIDELGSLDREA